MKRFKIQQKYDNSAKREILHYGILVAGLLFFVGMAALYMGNFRLQLLMFSGAISFYAIWGLVHHYTEKRLNMFVASEYLIFASIAFMLLLLTIGEPII